MCKINIQFQREEIYIYIYIYIHNEEEIYTNCIHTYARARACPHAYMYCGSQISDYRISDVRLAEALVVDNNILFPLLTFAACLCHSLSFAKRTSHRFERTHSPRSFYNLFLFFFPFLHEMLFANDKQQTSKSIRRTGEHILPQTNKLVAGLCDSTLTFLTNELRDARIAELAQDR